MNEHSKTIQEVRGEMYACLVSSVDSVISELELLSLKPDLLTPKHVKQISAKLKSALLRSEDLYVSAGEAESIQ